MDHHKTAALKRENAVLRYILDHFAAAQPDAVFVKHWPGETWTYSQTLARVKRRASCLAAHGVKRGDHVLCWMGNGPDLLATWFAINYLGAVYVPVNTALQRQSLEHILTDADASLMIAEAQFCDRLDHVKHGMLKTVLVPDADAVHLVDGLVFEVLHDPDAPDLKSLELDRPIEPWDTQAIMYTSGTTGHAKGVVSTYTQLYTMGPDAFDCIEPGDRCMVAGPIFHCGSTLYVYLMLARGGSIALMREFKTDLFWQAVTETKSTFTLLLGVMASFLLKQPDSDADRKHTLRKVFIVPFGDDAPVFAKRFGVDLYTVYNMTEIASPLSAGPGITEKGLAGNPRPWFEVKVVDQNDIEVPVGEVGELVVRSHRPWALMKGYYKRPDATQEAMRNGWFHTGDSFREDAKGRFFFVDRSKDLIRRRGENISSFALEGEITTLAEVREAAAIAVPSEHSEDEVMVIVAPAPGHSVDPAKLVADLAARLPRFMVPRFIRVVAELPKTASGKVQKHLLRSQGVTKDTFSKDTRD